MQSFLVAIVPSVGVSVLFWLALRAIFQADRRERAAQSRFESEQSRLARVDAEDGEAGR